MVTHSSTKQLPIQWKKYLSNSQNNYKEELLHFLAQEWSAQGYVARVLFQGQQLFVTDSIKCYRLSHGSDLLPHVEAVTSLECHREEADTRLVLHAFHASTVSYQLVVIKSPDTDVAVLAIAHICIAFRSMTICFS